jgi:hypothetical protein
MTYIEKHYAFQRRDGTSKLPLGITGSLPRLIQVRPAMHEVLKAKIVAHPRGDNRPRP